MEVGPVSMTRQMVQSPQQQRQQPNHAVTESDDGGSREGDGDKVAALLEQIMALLRLLLGVSSKLVRPTLEQIISKSIPTINYIYRQVAPRRIRDWLRIVQTSMQNGLQIITQTPQGRELSEETIETAFHAKRLLTSANSRQLLVESVGSYVKLIDALRTPETKAFLTSLPVILCRIADTLASGDAKCLYHSSTEVILKLIETIGQPETTLALAEITAELCYVLEMEREFYDPRRRTRGRTKKLRRGRRRKIRLAGYMSSDETLCNAKRRYGRNRFIRNTYRDRELIQDEGNRNQESNTVCDVEDAILSSLGDCTLVDNAWFLGLGNKNLKGGKEDEVSLPSRVVLHKTANSGDSIEETDTISLDFELDSPEKMIENANENPKLTNVDYLRSGIKKRENCLIQRELTLSKEDNIRAKALASDSKTKSAGSTLQNADSASTNLDIEDLVLRESNTLCVEDKNNLLCGEKETVEKNTSKIIIADEDSKGHYDGNADSLSHCKTTPHAKNPEFRGSTSASVHFFRALDDVHRALCQDGIPSHNDGDNNKEIGSDLNQKPASMAQRNDTHNGRRYFRFISSDSDKVKSERERKEPSTPMFSHLLSLLNLSKKQKRYIFLGGIVAVSFCGLILGFGCYGFYKFFLDNETAIHLDPKTSTLEPNEFVIRIVHENVPIDSHCTNYRSAEKTILPNVINSIESGIISQDNNLKERVEQSLHNVKDII